MEGLMLQQIRSAEKKASAKSFEEVIGEIDKEIKEYDSNTTMSLGFGVGTGKENYVDHPSINEVNVSCPSTNAAYLSSSSRIPLAEIPSSLVNHVHAEETWKRLIRGHV